MHPLQPTGTSLRLIAPPSLTNDEQSLFTEIVSSVEPRHFAKSDLPQIVSYVQVTLACRAHATRAAADPNKNIIAAWEKLLRTQLALARSLRLTVQSRIDPLTIGRRANDHGRPLTFSDTVRLRYSEDHSGVEADQDAGDD